MTISEKTVNEEILVRKENSMREKPRSKSLGSEKFLYLWKIKSEKIDSRFDLKVKSHVKSIRIQLFPESTLKSSQKSKNFAK